MTLTIIHKYYDCVHFTAEEIKASRVKDLHKIIKLVSSKQQTCSSDRLLLIIRLHCQPQTCVTKAKSNRYKEPGHVTLCTRVREERLSTVSDTNGQIP